MQKRDLTAIADRAEKVSKILRNIFDNLREFGNFNGIDLRIIGSSILSDTYNDIDVVVKTQDDYAKMIFVSSKSMVKIHPILKSPAEFGDIHNLMSFQQHCFAAALNGQILIGDCVGESLTTKYLTFNRKSVNCFPNARSVLDAAFKSRLHDTTSTQETTKLKQSIVMNLAEVGDVSDMVVLLTRSLISPVAFHIIRQLNGVVAGGCLRDIVMCKSVKDIDVFMMSDSSWDAACQRLIEQGLTEIPLPVQETQPDAKKINVRKFRDFTGSELDVIRYSCVSMPQHVVDTFDFSINMLWLNLQTATLEGPSGISVTTIIDHIRRKQLVVGDKMWFRAGIARALNRWQRFRDEGFVADEENQAAYSKYVNMMIPKKRDKG